jgi:hypothetical protein
MPSTVATRPNDPRLKSYAEKNARRYHDPEGDLLNIYALWQQILEPHGVSIDEFYRREREGWPHGRGPVGHVLQKITRGENEEHRGKQEERTWRASNIEEALKVTGPVFPIPMCGGSWDKAHVWKFEKGKLEWLTIAWVECETGLTHECIRKLRWKPCNALNGEKLAIRRVPYWKGGKVIVVRKDQIEALSEVPQLPLGFKTLQELHDDDSRVSQGLIYDWRNRESIRQGRPPVDADDESMALRSVTVTSLLPRQGTGHRRSLTGYWPKDMEAIFNGDEYKHPPAKPFNPTLTKQERDKRSAEAIDDLLAGRTGCKQPSTDDLEQVMKDRSLTAISVRRQLKKKSVLRNSTHGRGRIARLLCKRGDSPENPRNSRAIQEMRRIIREKGPTKGSRVINLLQKVGISRSLAYELRQPAGVVVRSGIWSEPDAGWPGQDSAAPPDGTPAASANSKSQGGRPRKTELHKKWERLHAQGHSLNQIARDEGVKRNTVVTALRNLKRQLAEAHAAAPG